ncbi:MAG: YfhO family protein [Siculibacillus sp.]|nr:YfhO family protein [Siculibacillus sp.]
MTASERTGRPRFDLRLLGAIAVVAAAWVVLTRPWLSGTFAVPWDAEAHFRPQMAFLAHSLHAGEGIAWNPYVFAGWSQIADPQSLIFAPAFLVLALFVPDPGAVALDATVFAQLGVGALALLLWFRDRGWHAAGGTVAALAFAFGGSAAWRIQHTGQVLSFGWIPIVLFLLGRMLDRRSAGWGFLAGVAAGFMALGRDQIALLGLHFLVAYAVVEILAAPDRWSRLGRTLVPGVAGIVGGLLVVTVPVMMTLLLAEHSNRPAIDFVGAGRGSLHPASLIGAAIADLFGQGAQDVDFWGPPSPAFGVTDIYLAQNMTAVYAGALPAVAILVFGIGRGLLLRPGIRFQTLAALFFVLYALGWYTPAFRVFYDHLPGVALFRRPADATFLIGFSLAVLGGFLVHQRVTEELPPAGRPVRAFQTAMLLVVFAVLPIAFGLHADRLALVWKPLTTAAVFSAAALVVLAVAGDLARRGGTFASLGAIFLLGAFSTADLAWNNAPNESTAYPAATYDALATDTRDPVIPFLKKKLAETATPDRRDRVELAGVGFHWPNAGMIHRLENTLGYNPLRFDFYAAATGAIDHVGLPEQKEFSLLEPSYDSLLADMLGLRFIVTGAPVETMDRKLAPGRLTEIARFPAIPGIPPAPGRPETFVYENPRALPRVLFVDAARSADFDAIIASGAWPEGFDPRREVLLPAAALPGGAVAGETGPAGNAAITLWRNTRVDVDVEATRAGWLVLNDVWHRWWRVEVDGLPAKLERADVLFRAVRLEPGRHHVSFTFHPFAGLWEDVEARRAAH